MFAGFRSPFLGQKEEIFRQITILTLRLGEDMAFCVGSVVGISPARIPIVIHVSESYLHRSKIFWTDLILPKFLGTRYDLC